MERDAHDLRAELGELLLRERLAIVPARGLARGLLEEGVRVGELALPGAAIGQVELGAELRIELEARREPLACGGDHRRGRVRVELVGRLDQVAPLGEQRLRLRRIVRARRRCDAHQARDEAESHH